MHLWMWHPPPRTAWVCWILLLIKLGYFTCSRGSPQVLRDGQKGVFFVVGIFRECSSPNTCGKHQEHHSVSNENRVVYPREGPACRPSLKCHVTFITLVLIWLKDKGCENILQNYTRRSCKRKPIDRVNRWKVTVTVCSVGEVPGCSWILVILGVKFNHKVSPHRWSYTLS